MASIAVDTLATALTTLRDVLPIAVVLVGFQFLVLRRPVPNLRRMAAGFAYVLVGLTFFVVGLNEALFPLGTTMATQLTAPQFTGAGVNPHWSDYGWVYGFAAAVGFAATIAEPALIAVAMKAEDISGGAVNARGLRIAVAAGVAVGVSLGVFRIVTGTPLAYYIMASYAIVMVQTWRTRRAIIPIAFDSGGVTTSTITVPVLTALGLGLAAAIPGRSPLLDGFGLIAFACLFPVMSVMGYAMIADWRRRRRQRGLEKEGTP